MLFEHDDLTYDFLAFVGRNARLLRTPPKTSLK